MISRSRGARKILFLSSGETISRMFVSVIRELGGGNHQAMVVNQDFFYSEDSETILEEGGVATRSLRNYGVFDARSILRQEDPDVVVLGHAGGAVEASFIVACRSLGTPTLLLQDGIIGPPASLSWSETVTMLSHMVWSNLRKPKALLRYLFFLNSFGLRHFLREISDWSKVTHIYARELCSKVAVMGPYAKRVFAELGYDEDDIVVTGQPRFDALVSPGESRELVCQKLGIESSRRILLFAAPVFRTPDRQRGFIRTLVRATRHIKGIAIVVKVHPREDPAPYVELLSAEGAGESSVVGDFPVPALVHACDLFLSNYSTMTLEALLVGRPVLLLKTEGESVYTPFDEVGVAVTVGDDAGLETAIRDLMVDEGPHGDLEGLRERFVFEHAYGGDGKASKRAAMLIREL